MRPRLVALAAILVTTGLPLRTADAAPVASTPTTTLPDVVTLFGDSTGNENDEWFRLGIKAWARTRPDLTVEYDRWNPDASPAAYTPTRTIQTGTGAATITFRNASKGRTTFRYQTAQLDEMLPTASPNQVVLLSSSHNYGRVTPAEYEVVLDDIVAHVQDRVPAAAITFVSQNPRFDPAEHVSRHRARLVRGRAWAGAHGYGYLANLEAWDARADGGLSLVRGDHVHPTRGGGDTGSALWAGVLRDYLTATYPVVIG